MICFSRANITSELKAQYHFLNRSNLEQLLAFSLMNFYQVKLLSNSHLAKELILDDCKTKLFK